VISQAEKQFIESRTWYQTIDFCKDVRSKGYEWCGDPAWQNIKQFLPKTLEGKRVLDLGCNAGLFCVKAALMGAKEVVGVDWHGWRPDLNFIEQQEFVRSFFEKKYRRKLPIEFLDIRMDEYLKRHDIGRFDYVFAIASIYYAEDPYQVVRKLADIADNVIVRLRDESIIHRFTELFKRGGFVEVKTMRECWADRLHVPADDFYLYHYSKDKILDIFYYRLVSGHEEIAGTKELLDIWQLIDLIGTWKDGEYTQRIPQKYLANIHLKKFCALKNCKRTLTPEQMNAYPWADLIKSIAEKGILAPLVVEEIFDEDRQENMYLVLEGRHRLKAAAVLGKIDDPYFFVPCLVVKKEGKRV
jgi:SAM-dependent methyltransferase